jgi:hypothetical protein
MEKEAPSVSGSILEGLNEMLTVNKLRLPPELRRSLACTNAIENMQGTIRRVTRNVKHWRDASMALRWAAAGMMEAKAGFRRLQAYRQLPALRRALAEHQTSPTCRASLPALPVPIARATVRWSSGTCRMVDSCLGPQAA